MNTGAAGYLAAVRRPAFFPESRSVWVAGASPAMTDFVFAAVRHGR
jgi:hypothetical protein